MLNIIYNEDVHEVAKEAAKIFEDLISKTIHKKGFAVVGFPGGRSIAPVLNEIRKTRISWSKVHIFMIDERLVSIDNVESNYRLLREQLFNDIIQKGKMPEKNLHPFILKNKADFGLKTYEEELENLGGKYDIIFLGAGEDGHVGALYPGHKGLRLNDANYISLHDSPKPPKDRMTASVKLLQKAQAAFLLFFWEAKKKAYTQFLDNRITLEKCPAKLVNNIEKVYILTDLKD